LVRKACNLVRKGNDLVGQSNHFISIDRRNEKIVYRNKNNNNKKQLDYER
jgi:hypothetical protein